MLTNPLLPEVSAEVEKILKSVAHNDAQAIKVLAGRGGKLRSAKPKQGIYAYVWRMCTFHSGIDPTMPVVAEMDLQRGIKEVLKDKGYTKFRDVPPDAPMHRRRDATLIFERDLREHKATMDLIDGRGGLVDRVLKQFGLDPFGAARRWRGLLASQKVAKDMYVPLGRLDDLRRDPKAHLMIIHAGRGVFDDYQVKTLKSREFLKAFLDKESLRSNGGWQALIRDRMPKNMISNHRYEWEDDNWKLPVPRLTGPDLRAFIRDGQTDPRLKTAARQMLLTAVDRKRLPALYSQDGVRDPIVYVRFFNAYGAGTWLATEFDGQDQFFGWAEIHPGMGELGYFSLRELQSLPARMGGRVIPGLQGIERDTSFTPKPLSQAKRD